MLIKPCFRSSTTSLLWHQILRLLDGFSAALVTLGVQVHCLLQSHLSQRDLVLRRTLR